MGAPTLTVMVPGYLRNAWRRQQVPALCATGKTGTPEIANPAGGYYTDRFNGTYIGYVGGRQPQYVIVVRVNEPHIGGFGGSGAAQPIFGSIAHMLIDNFAVVPKN